VVRTARRRGRWRPHNARQPPDIAWSTSQMALQAVRTAALPRLAGVGRPALRPLAAQARRWYAAEPECAIERLTGDDQGMRLPGGLRPTPHAPALPLLSALGRRAGDAELPRHCLPEAEPAGHQERARARHDGPVPHQPQRAPLRPVRRRQRAATRGSPRSDACGTAGIDGSGGGGRDARVVILKSTVDKVFCAGADLKERAAMNETEVASFVHGLRTAFTDLEVGRGGRDHARAEKWRALRAPRWR